MDHAIRLHVMVGEDHMIRLPDEIPTGAAEVIVLMPARDESARKAETRRRLFGALQGKIVIADDFDAPLPEDVLRDFEGPIEP